eukprot:gene24464-32915_t
MQNILENVKLALNKFLDLERTEAKQCVQVITETIDVVKDFILIQNDLIVLQKEAITEQKKLIAAQRMIITNQNALIGVLQGIESTDTQDEDDDDEAVEISTAAKGPTTSFRGAYEQYVMHCFDEMQRSTSPLVGEGDQFDLREFVAKLLSAPAGSIPPEAVMTQKLLDYAKSCGCELPKLYETLCNDVNGLSL